MVGARMAGSSPGGRASRMRQVTVCGASRALVLGVACDRPGACQRVRSRRSFHPMGNCGI